MAGKSQGHADSVLNIVRGITPSIPTNIYIGLLSTVPPTDNSSGTELSGNGYARQSATFGAPTDAAESGTRQIANTNTITFGPAVTADWATAEGFAVYDAVTAGNLLYWDYIRNAGGTPVTKTVQVGDEAKFSIGNLLVKED